MSRKPFSPKQAVEIPAPEPELPRAEERESSMAESEQDSPAELQETAEAAYAARREALRAQAGATTPTVNAAPAPVPQVAAPSQTEADLAYQRRREELVVAQARFIKESAAYAAGERSIPPVATRGLNRRRSDPTIPRDENGNDIRDPRFRYKWVPDVDLHGVVGNGTKVDNHLEEGFEVVIHNGEPLKKRYGTLMRIPGELAAEYEMANAPTGSISAADYLKATSQAAQQANRQFGGEYLHMGVSQAGSYEKHGSDFFNEDR